MHGFQYAPESLMSSDQGSLTYRDAGVDIDAGDELVERIKPLAKMTRIAEVLSDVGGFAGLCRVLSSVVTGPALSRFASRSRTPSAITIASRTP